MTAAEAGGSDSRPGGRTLSKDDRAALKQFSERSDGKGLVQLGMHGAALAAGVVAIALSWGTVWYWPAALLAGLPLIFLFAPLHETIHRTAFESRWLNDAVAAVCGFVLILPPDYFRAFHLEHHRVTQIEGKDPELPGRRIGTLGQYLWHVSGLPYWIAASRTLALHAIGRIEEPFIAGTQAQKVRREAALYLGLYLGLGAAAVWLRRPEPLAFWLIPALMGQPFLRLFLLAEHHGCPLVADMFRNTRTTLSNAIVRRLAWNMPYHIEHHAFMAVPFHALPKAHARFRDRIEVLSPGYAGFHRDLVTGLPKA